MIIHLWLVLLVPLRYQPLTCAKVQINCIPLTLRGGLSGVLDLAILLQTGISCLHKHKFYSKIGKDYVFGVGSRHQNDACLKCLEFGRPTWGIFVFWPLGGCFPTSAFKTIELEGNFGKAPWTWAILFKAFHIYFYCLKVFFLAPNATAGRLLIFIPERAAGSGWMELEVGSSLVPAGDQGDFLWHLHPFTGLPRAQTENLWLLQCRPSLHLWGDRSGGVIQPGHWPGGRRASFHHSCESEPSSTLRGSCSKPFSTSFERMGPGLGSYSWAPAVVRGWGGTHFLQLFRSS